jgi:pyrroloquinoline quinone biosynthesis protein D
MEPIPSEPNLSESIQTEPIQAEPIPSKLTPDTRPRLAARARIQQDKVSGKPAVLHPEGVLLLNPTGHAIVELCDGERTVTEIAGVLAAQYNAPIDQLLPDVLEYLSRLYDRKLLDLRPKTGTSPYPISLSKPENHQEFEPTP